MEERRHSNPAMSTTTDFLSPQPQHQYYYSPTINNTAAAGIQMSDIYGGVMSSTYCHQDPRVQGHQHSSSTLDVDYEVRDDQDVVDCELLAALINNHVENKEEEIVPWQSAGDDVSSWEWPRFGGTLESIVDQAPCLVPLIIQHVPDHGKAVEEEEEEKDDDQVALLEDQQYCHMVPQVLADQIENTVVQSKHSTCNTEWMTVEEEDEEHDQCYPTSHNTTPPPPPLSYHSQREARKITEKRQMQRGKSSTATISSSTNKRSKATILHNKSERKRRGKINDRLETLQKLLPNFHKQTDKASMLDQVIEYVKKLQTQNDQMKNMRLGMFDNNNMPVAAVHPTMMMPHYITTMQAMQQQQQQQMSMMTQMGMGMGMGMSMNPAGTVMMPRSSIVHPNMRQE